MKIEREVLQRICEELEGHSETYMKNQTIRCTGCDEWVLDDAGTPLLDHHKVDVVVSMLMPHIDAHVQTEVQAARAEVGTKFAEWAFKNEIAEPPLDWAWYGEVVRWTGSPAYEQEAADDV